MQIKMKINVIQVSLALSCMAVVAAASVASSRNAPDLSIMPFLLNRRAGKSLVNQFPFNQGGHQRIGHHGDHHGAHHGAHHGDHHGDHHGSHGDHHGSHGHHSASLELPQRLDNRFGKQSPEEEETDAGGIDLGEVAAAGQRCVQKVLMTEETIYDDSIECHHSYDKRCQTTYLTDYVPQQVEDCDENFVKECHIEYKKIAFNETVEICNERPVRDCEQQGPTVCEKVYESECETTYHVHEVEEDTPVCETQMMEKCREVTQGYSTKQECDKWPQQVCNLEKKKVKKYSPETECKKIPREVCGPGPCPIVAGPKECRNEQKTVVQEHPQETCSLRAQPFCEYETKLVPVLKPRENCVDVPKEVCVRVRTNPRKVKKPIIKKWCYKPTEESGSVETTTTERPEPITAESRTVEIPDTLYGAPPPDGHSDYAAALPPPPRRRQDGEPIL